MCGVLDNYWHKLDIYRQRPETLLMTPNKSSSLMPAPLPVFLNSVNEIADQQQVRNSHSWFYPNTTIYHLTPKLYAVSLFFSIWPHTSTQGLLQTQPVTPGWLREPCSSRG